MALSANSAFIKFQGDKLKQFQFSCLYVGARKRGLSFLYMRFFIIIIKGS